MAERTEKLRLVAETEGFEKASADVGKVSGAKEDLKKKIEGATPEVEKAAEAQQKLNASESDFVGVLSQIDPRLGGLVDTMLKSSKIAGDMASQQISLTGALGKATEAIKANAGALKLIGAGGAVVVAIYAIVRAVQKMREEFEAVTGAISSTIDAMTELRQEQRGQQQAMEGIAAQRPEGGFKTVEEARAAEQRRQKVRERVPFVSPDAVAQAVALGGAERGTEELSRIAFLLQTPGRLPITPEMGAGVRERHIEHALKRDSEVITQELALQAQQQKELYREASQQMGTRIGGSLDALIAVLEQTTRGEGVDPARLARGMQFLPEAQRALGTGFDAFMRRAFGPGGLAELLQSAMEQAGVTVEGGKFTPEELAIMERDKQLIESQAAKLNEAAQALKDAAETLASTPPVQNFNYQNAKFVGPDAASQARRITNGENRSRLRKAG